MFIYKLISIMFISISLKIHFSTVFQFFQYLEQSVENLLSNIEKKIILFFISYIIGFVYLDKHVSDLCSLQVQA